MNEIVIFDQVDQPIEVRLEANSVWLTQTQLCELFGRERSVITKHINNVFKEGELVRDSVCAKFAHTAEDGKTYSTQHYNLDVIISVGYRVKSQRGVLFRQWATRILREHLTQGYSLSARRLARQGLNDLTQALDLLGKTLVRQELVTDVGHEVIGLILGYSRTWRLLLDYDEDKLSLPAGSRPAKGVLGYAEARRALDALKVELQSRGEASELFARDRGDNLSSILGNIEQSMFGKSLYKTREERAAHLLYFVIKNHPFTDGNKRSGAFLFLLYLRQEGMRLPLDELGLTALTLLIAESDAKAKDLMVRLVMNLLAPNTEQVRTP
jgi:prophage maintenance system killer protein